MSGNKTFVKINPKDLSEKSKFCYISLSKLCEKKYCFSIKTHIVTVLISKKCKCNSDLRVISVHQTFGMSNQASTTATNTIVVMEILEYKLKNVPYSCQMSKANPQYIPLKCCGAKIQNL